MANWSATSHEPLRSCGKGELADSGDDRRQRRRSNLFGLLLVAVGAFEVDLDRAARLPLHLRHSLRPLQRSSTPAVSVAPESSEECARTNL